MRFEVLYHFSHGPIHLVETKRLDLPPSARPGEIYQWSLIEERKVYSLKFVSMTLVPQKRFFEEGEVEMDLNRCHGKLLNQEIELNRQDTMTDSLRKLIEDSLRTKT
jgi:hypothetical protein